MTDPCEWPAGDEAASDPESLPSTVTVFGDLNWHPELRGSPDLGAAAEAAEDPEAELVETKADGHIEIAKAELGSTVIWLQTHSDVYALF